MNCMIRILLISWRVPMSVSQFDWWISFHNTPNRYLFYQRLSIIYAPAHGESYFCAFHELSDAVHVSHIRSRGDEIYHFDLF